MYSSKKIPLVILGVTAIAFSRAMFAFFNDPEGPNLLVVLVTAAIVYGLSLAVYFYSRQGGFKKLVLPIVSQLVIVAGLYLCLS